MRQHTRTVTATAAALLFAAAVAGCSGSGSDNDSHTTGSHDGGRKVEVAASASASASASATSAAKPTLNVAKGSLGKILVDDKGRTLYLFDKDTKTKSNCTGACAAAWPPLTDKTKPTLGSGLKADLLTTIDRSGGMKQVAYNGHPLYRFQGDTKAGNTNGQGLDQFGAKWYVVDPAGKQITKSAQNSGGTGY